MVKAVAALINNHDYVTSIIKKPTSFIRKIEKKIKDKSEMKLPVPELKNDDNIKEGRCPHSFFSLGPYSDDIDFNINDINNYISFCGQKYFQFTNGSVFEIGQYRLRNFT